MGFFDFMNEDIAIDLGTANTLIIHNDKVVVDEPSIVAIETRTGKVIAVGTKAQQMHGKAHKGIETTRPLKDGVIADFDAAEHMIREFIKKIPSLKKEYLPLQGYVWLFAFPQVLQKLKRELLEIQQNIREQKKYI